MVIAVFYSFLTHLSLIILASINQTMSSKLPFRYLDLGAFLVSTVLSFG